jgi:CBS domain-containing protein
MKPASEIMNPNVLSVHPEDSLEDAIRVFNINRVSGLPVIDGDGKVTGMLSDRDILAYSEKLMAVPLFSSSGWLLQYNEFPKRMVAKKAGTFSNTKVKEVMSEKAVTVREDAPWFEVVSLMRKNSINRLPVVDKNGKLSGIITRTDIINHMADSGIID